MIRFIYGNHGCGKTEYIFSELNKDAAAGTPAILIVPEQMTVLAERRAAEELPADAQLNIEVLNFTRLCNRVFRQTGGLVCTHATEGVRRITMQRALKAVGPLLDEYGINASVDLAMPEKMLKVYDEFVSCGITPEEASEAVAKLTGSTQSKLKDIATVISVYRQLIGENFEEPARDLERLCGVEKPSEIFGNVKIYLDAFSGLTGLQHNVVKLLMKHAKDVTISIPLASPSENRADTESLKRMSVRLRADAAASGNQNETIILDTPYRYINNDHVLALMAGLWSSERIVNDEECGTNVKLITASDDYDEAESCAAEIRKLVSEGYRYKDIAVIARHADSIRGITDRALEEAGINVFLSEKTPLSAYAPARFILSALRIITGGWQREDVSAHIKTGLCDVKAEDADLFEIYTETWRISGKGFTSGEWLMNPDGYREDLTPRSKRILEIANKVREKVCVRLGILEEKLRRAKTCADMCRAIYDYMLELNIPGQMSERAENAVKNGRIREAKEAARIFDETVQVLDEVNDAYGENDCPDLADFSRALRTGLDAYALGSIPVSSDSVVIGSADTMRVDRPKCVILLGVYDGSFPAVPDDNGLFGVKEREELSEVLSLMRDRESAASDELYFLRRAAAFASDRLIIYTRKDESSVAVSNIRRILPKLSPVSSDADITDRITSPEMAASYSNLLGATPEGAALARILAENGATDPASLSAKNPVGSDKLSLSADAAEAAAGKDMIFSQSKLETFLSCPFKYYCKYTLGLTPKADSAFSFAPIGTFIHAILEEYLRDIYVNRGGAFPTDGERQSMLDEITAGILERLAPPDSGTRTARLEHLSHRLKALADVITSDLVTELSDSDFVPSYFEMKIGKEGVPPLSFNLKNGGKVSIEGYIDRVDVYREGNKAYLRCVDYKTGTKTFSFDDIDKGENLQLLLYLFSLTKNPDNSSYFGPGLSLEEGSFVYVSANVPRISGKVDDTEGIKQAAADEIVRTGAIRAEDSVINAVSHSGNKKYLMGDEKKRPTVDKDNLNLIFEKVSKILTDTADSICAGKAAAVPKNGGESCKYCEFADVCRSARKKED